jgi:hypothetical protein
MERFSGEIKKKIKTIANKIATKIKRFKISSIKLKLKIDHQSQYENICWEGKWRKVKKRIIGEIP